MKPVRNPFGFSLVELMVTIAILAIITAIAVPVYEGYLREAQLATARANADSLRVFLEDWRLDNNTYQLVIGETTFDPKAAAQLGWSPDGDNDLYVYQVINATANNYTVTVTAPGGRWLRCEDRMRTCCDGTGSITACP